MVVDSRQIEGRNYGVIPLVGGVDLQEAKALVLPGTLQDTLNYEVVSRGYTRGQGLLQYHGTYDAAIEDFWYVSDVDEDLTITVLGSFTLGGRVTWEGGEGTCIYWDDDTLNLSKALGIVDVDGVSPSTVLTFTDVVTGTVMTIMTPPTTLATAIHARTGADIAGTVTDYLAFINEVNTSIAALTNNTWPYFKPTIPGTGAITGGFQFKDNIYAARDFNGIGFGENDLGQNPPNVGDLLEVGLLQLWKGKVARVELESGSWENGDATGVVFFEPSFGGSNDPIDFDIINDGDFIYNSTESNYVGRVVSAYNKNKGQLWEAVASITNEDYLASGSNLAGWKWLDLGYGLRFKDGVNPPSAKVAPLFLPSTDEETAAVQDTGNVLVSTSEAVGIVPTYSAITNIANIYADDATYAESEIPLSGASQLIECSPADYVDATEAEIIGIEVSFEAYQDAGNDVYIKSLRLVNDATGAIQYQSDDVADDAFINQTPTVYTFGQQIDLWGMESISAEDLNSGDLKVQLQFGNANALTRKTVYLDYVQIKVHYIARGQTLYFNDGSSDVATAQVYSFELHDGDWHIRDEIAEVLSTGTVTLDTGTTGSVSGIVVDGVEIMSASVPFATDLPTTATNVASNITAFTSSPNYTAAATGTKITISAVAGTGDGPDGFNITSTTALTAPPITTTDTDMAGGVDYSALLGDTATGHMSFHNVSDPGAIKAGMTMYTRASKGGVVIAVTAADLSRNLLPSEAELLAEKAKWRVIEASFWQNDEGNAIYGATGADSAFMFDLNDKFAYIRPPISRSKDKPRHVAFHANHLVLGLDSGHILVSAVDVPNDFDTAGTATTWPFRDPITGLNPLAGNALGVMCRESVNALIGTQAPIEGANDPFRTQNITPNAGAIEYTLADVMGPMYADFNGVTSVEASDKFGDFGAGRLTVAIEDWTRDRFQNRPSSELGDKGAVLAAPIRAKNQYRIYFEDGYILNLYLGVPGQPSQPMFSHLDPTGLTDTYVPTWLDSTILSTGRERVVMGDKNGNVWIVDGANGIQTASGLETVACYITTNPVNTGYPQGAHKTLDFSLMGEFMGAQTITTSVGYDYLDVSSTPRTKTIGSYSAAPLFSVAPDLTNIYVDSFTDGTSLKIETAMDGSKPHTLHTLIHRFSRLGSGKNNTQVAR